MKVKTFSERLKEALRIRNVRQIELSEKANIPKSAICQYLSGRFSPKQDRLADIAAALEVSEAWLMGYDVPISQTPLQQPTEQKAPTVTDNDLKAALFDGNKEVTEEMWDEVKRYARYIRDRENSKKG